MFDTLHIHTIPLSSHASASFPVTHHFSPTVFQLPNFPHLGILDFVSLPAKEKGPPRLRGDPEPSIPAVMKIVGKLFAALGNDFGHFFVETIAFAFFCQAVLFLCHEVASFD